MTPAVIIARVSSDDQREGFSLDAQIDLCHDYAKREGLPVDRVFQFSESARGKKKRAEFHAVIDYLSEHNISHLIVEKMDRLLRNLPDYGLAEQIVESGVTIHLVKEGRLHKDSTAHERLIFGFKALLAKSYSDNLSEEIKKGTKKKLESGLPLRRLYGYRQHERQVTVIEKEADVVRRIYREYLGGLNIIEIADLLNAEGVPAPRGPRWNNQTVHRTLTRPDYIGEMVFRGKQYQGNYDLIIDPADFYAVQRRIKTGNRKSDPSRWPLSGLVRWESGRLLSGQTVKGHLYYGAPVDDKKRVRRYVRQDQLMHDIGEAVASTRWPERFARHVLDFARACYANETKTRQSARKEAFDKLHKLRAKAERLTGLYLEGEIERFDYLRRKHDIEAEIVKAEAIATAENIDNKNFIEQVDRVAHVFHELPDIYASASLTDKAKILRAYVRGIVVSPDKELIRLEYRQPFAAFLTPEILSISGSSFPDDMETSGTNSNRFRRAERSAERVLLDLFYKAA